MLAPELGLSAAATMHLIGIPLRKPSLNEITAAAALAVGLWLMALGLFRTLDAPPTRDDAVGLLLVCAWGSLSARLGIRLEQGGRHVVANVAVSALLVGAWQVASTLLG